MDPQQANSKTLLLVGPTAAGKTEVALCLAEQLGGEIISVDSMQVYRGMDIGTAKPSNEERQRIPHHLLDVVEVAESFDAAQFIPLAQAAVQDIQNRGRVPILCGGTGLYFKAFLEGVGVAPRSDPVLRAELETTPLPALLKELAARDPALFETIDQKNTRRVIRAIEVIRITGKPFSQQRAGWSRQDEDADYQLSLPFFGLARTSEDLHCRINARVEQMFQRGLVMETETLLKKGLAENRTALQALGYRQVVEYLRGERSLADTIELVKLRTRQFAKRQMTWFRHQAKVKWTTINPQQTAEEITRQLFSFLPPEWK